MGRMTALEALKVDVVLQDTIKKLYFLSTLKNTTGSEMSEMMSEEIQRVMTEQRNLEEEYADLIQRRSQLKGISKKAELEEVKNQLTEVAKRLKDSTRTLCRVLKDNPDIEGGNEKIKQDRLDLIETLQKLSKELTDLSYSKHKQDLDDEKKRQGRLEELRAEEKNLIQKIKSIEKDHKTAKETATKHQEENLTEIAKLKTQLNEAQTDSDLYLKYLADENSGIEDCQARQYHQSEQTLLDKIEYLQQQKVKESKASNQIRKFLEEKKNDLDGESTRWEQKKEEELLNLENQTNEITQKRTDDSELRDKIKSDILREQEILQQKREEEKQKEEALDAKRQEKIDQENAIIKIQQKWKWFDETGRFIKRKKKKGKKGKKKKKKK